MPLRDYQQQIDNQLQTFAKPYWEPLSQLARITEEVGEVARILNHQYGDKPKKTDEAPQELADELADVLYAIICLANSEKIELDAALQRVMQKPLTRDKDRYAKK